MRRARALCALLLIALVFVPNPAAAAPRPRTSLLLCTFPGTSVPCPDLVKLGIPTDAAGAGTATGVAAGEGTPVGWLTTAFAGGFAGGCWLGSQIWDSGSCTSGLAKIWHWATGGDDRSQANGFSASVCAGAGNCAPLIGNYTYLTSPGKLGWPSFPAPYVLYARCFVPSTGADSGYVAVFYNTGSATQGNFATNVNCGTSLGAPYTTAGTQILGFIQYNGTVPSGTVVGTPIPSGLTGTWFWRPDPGNGTSWTYTWTETCQQGTTQQTATRTVTFTPTASTDMPLPPTMPTCDSILPGSHLEKIHGTGGRGGAGDLTIDVPTWNTGITTSYPLCSNRMPTKDGCALDLQRNGKSCYDGATLCAGWTTYESEMKCLWGPYTVPIKWCEDDLGTTFDIEVAPKPGTSTTVAGGPTTSVDPSASSSTSVSPGSGTGTSPEPNVDLPASVGGHNCMSGIWSWNPVDWVFTPIKCALIWAFVPDTASLTDILTGIKTNIQTSGIGPWLTTLGTLFGGLGGNAAGCSGPAVTFPLTHTAMHPFDACSEPMATVASISYAFTSVAVVVLGGLSIARAVGAGFGFSLGLGSRATVSEK